MTDTLKPRDAKEVEAAVQWALAEGKALEVAGQGSKRAIGRPAQTDLTLDLSGLSGVTLYEPEELVLSARAGTPLARDRGAGRCQRPATRIRADGLRPDPRRGRRPRHHRRRARHQSRRVPRRIQAGAARDHFLGVTAVSGRGETFKSGGRVVKNVTGYDLCKLLAGSWGTLAAMTDVTIKTLPRPESEETILVLGLEPAARHRRDDGGDGLVLRRVRRRASAGRCRCAGTGGRRCGRHGRDGAPSRRLRAVGRASHRDLARDAEAVR